jgi:hypothetical protein
MNEKKCMSCKLIKTVSEFHKNKSRTDGLQTTCKLCRHYKSQPKKEKRKEYRKEWYKRNVENIKKMENDRYHSNKDEINHKKRENYQKDTLYREKNLDSSKKYYHENKETVKEKLKFWSQNNKDKRNEISRRYYHKFKTLMICRRLIKRTIKFLGTEKELTTLELLGYSPIELKESIQKKFKSGMTWENYGEWHIDHIRPISSFQKEDNPKTINDLDNLQPLWATENLSKGKKY